MEDLGPNPSDLDSLAYTATRELNLNSTNFDPQETPIKSEDDDLTREDPVAEESKAIDDLSLQKEAEAQAEPQAEAEGEEEVKDLLTGKGWMS